MLKKCLAEFIGTFALVFCGTGAIIINDITNGAVTHPGIAITFGLIVLAMIYAYGEISGAHINPAVSLAFYVSGKFKGKNLFPYISSQLSGAIAASLVLSVLFPSHQNLGATLPFGEAWQSFIIEILLTFFLMTVIIHVATGSKETGVTAGIAIGSVVLLEAMFAGPITGASMNPARSIAPALVSGNIQHLWLYIIGPIAGALLAVGAHKVITKD
ncbi:MAG: aquaporin NIP [Sphingobacteriales bacterium]|jgi:aquaporin NIP